MADRAPLLQVLRKPPAPPRERCDVCATPIAGDHDHLVNVFARTLLCACRACYLLFTHEGAGGGRFRAVPRRYAGLPELAGALDAVEELDIPIGLAFFMRNGATGRVTAFYPSPAGATESELPLGAWERLAAAAPILSSLAADVEALLVRRGAAALEGFIVPIDAAYELVGRIRRSWTGMSGGDEVSREIDTFFTRTAERAGALAGSARP